MVYRFTRYDKDVIQSPATEVLREYIALRRATLYIENPNGMIPAVTTTLDEFNRYMQQKNERDRIQIQGSR